MQWVNHKEMKMNGMSINNVNEMNGMGIPSNSS